MKYPHNENIKAVLEGCSDRVVNDGLNYLVPNWKYTVESLKNEALIEEYLNDIDTRYLIDQILEVLSEQERESVMNDVRPLDEIFKQKTHETDENVWGPKNEESHGWNREKQWYYYRSPKQLLNIID